MKSPADTDKIRILLTVPHLTHTASPYREMMGIAKYLPRNEFSLTICTLRKNGEEEVGPMLDCMGVTYFVAPFRPKGKTYQHYIRSLRAQKIIDQKGSFDIQHSLDFTTSPFEPIIAKIKGRRFVFSQRNMNEGGHNLPLRLKIWLTDHIIAISDQTKNLLTTFSAKEENISLVRNAIDMDIENTIEQTNERVISEKFQYPLRWTPEKNKASG